MYSKRDQYFQEYVTHNKIPERVFAPSKLGDFENILCNGSSYPKGDRQDISNKLCLLSFDIDVLEIEFWDLISLMWLEILAFSWQIHIVQNLIMPHKTCMTVELIIKLLL